MEEKFFNWEEIKEKLNSKNVNQPCHRCGNIDFYLVNGFSYLPIQDKYGKPTNFGGPNVPIILTGCTNCGAITPHALGALMSIQSDKEKEGQNG